MALSATKLPYKTAYALKRVVEGVQKELAYHDAERETLIKEFGAEREATPAELAQGMQPPIFEVLPEKRTPFFAKYAELLGVEVELKWTLTPEILEHFEVSSDDLRLLDAITQMPEEGA
jgi:hypothetical protein